MRGPTPIDHDATLLVDTGDGGDDRTLVADASTGATASGPAGDEPRRLQPGAHAGRYVILHELGAGGMGVVYAAYDPELDRKIALKLLRVDADRLAAGPNAASAAVTDARLRLLREAQALAKLAHPNVVAVHDVGEHDGAVYLAMEYVEGQTLGAWLGAGPQAWARVLPIFVAAAEGLAAAHAKGLVHRDFKPDNVMVGADGRVRVMDFGLARPELDARAPVEADPNALTEAAGDIASILTDASGRRPLDSALTRAGSLVGTPGYMAPEQFRSAATDARTDQYAFCVTLWEALCGERPVRGSTLAALAMNVVRGQRQPVPRGVSLPRWLLQALTRGLATNPAERFGSMAELLAALAQGQRRRRRMIGIAAASGTALLVAGLGLGRELAEQRQRAACAARGAELDARWNDDARARLRAGLAGSSAHAADTIAAKTLPWLDGWATDWASARAWVCEAAELDRSLAPELTARAEACLAAGRAEFEALVDRLSAPASAEAAYQATAAAAGLASPLACADPSYLQRRAQWPDLDRPDAAALVETLARARAHGSAHEYEAELAAARAAVEAADAVADPLLRIDADLALGVALSHQDQYAEAEAALIAGFTAAGELGDDDRALAAASHLVWVVGELQARYPEASVWTRAAELLRARVEPEPGVAAVRLAASAAVVASRQGQVDEGLAALDEAAEVLRRIHGDAHPELAALLGNRCVVLLEAGRLDEARPVGEQALAMTEATLGPEHPRSASILNSLANLEHLAGEHAAAEARLEQALALDRRVYGERHANVATTLNNLATLRFSMGEVDEAIAGLEQAAAIRAEIFEPNHPDVAVTYSNLGYILLHSGRPEQARPHYERALAAYEATLGPDHRDLAPALLGLAEIALHEGRDAEAIGYARRGIAIREAIEFPPARLAAPRFILARALWRAPAEAGGDRVAARAAAERALADVASDDPLAAELREWLAAPG